MKFISVIVPMHGPEPYLARSVEALLAQRYPAGSREIIFVDNGVTAETRAVVAGRPGVRVIDEPRPGAYAARNTGVRAARGDVIAFTDADCAVSPDWLAVVARTMADPRTNIVVGSYEPATRRFAATALAAYENAKNAYIFASTDDDLYYGFTNNMAVRAHLFDEIGEFIPRLRGSDAIFARAVVERYGHETVSFEPRMSVRHLEIENARDYYRKVFVHSRSIRALGSLVRHRPLGFRERFGVYRRTVRSANYGPLSALRLIVLLAAGMVVWQAGALVPWKDTQRGREDHDALEPARLPGVSDGRRWRRAV